MTPTLEIVRKMQKQIQALHQELLQVAHNASHIPDASRIIAQKDAEKRSLEAQPKSIQQKQHSLISNDFTSFFSSPYIPNIRPQPPVLQYRLSLSLPLYIPPPIPPRTSRPPPKDKPSSSHIQTPDPEASASSKPPPEPFLPIQEIHPISSFLRSLSQQPL